MSFEGVAPPPGSVIEHPGTMYPWLAELHRPELEPSPSITDDWPFIFTGPAETVKDLPPLETVSETWRLRPCLVLGLGGTAGPRVARPAPAMVESDW